MSKAKQGIQFFNFRIFRHVRLTALSFSFLCFSAHLTFAAGVAFVQTAGADTAQIRSLLQSAADEVNKPGEAEQDIRAAVAQSRQALLLSQKAHNALGQVAAYTILSQCFREKNEMAAGRTYAQQAIRLLPRASVTIEAANAYAEMSNYYDPENQDGILVKIQYYERNLAILRKIVPGSLKLADALKFYGDLVNIQYDAARAVPILKESLAIYEARGAKKLQDIYDLLGDALTTAGNTTDGLYYQLKALRTAEQYKDTSQMLSTIYFRLAFTYNAIGQDDRTAENLEKARFYALKNHDLHNWIIISGNLGTIYNKLKRYGQATTVSSQALSKCAPADYQNQARLITNLLYPATMTRNYKAAAVYYSRLKNLTQRDNVEMNVSSSAMIEYLLATRQFAEARLEVDKLISITKTTQSLISKQKIEFYSFKLDSAAGRYLSAIMHQQQSHQLRDSLLARNYNKQIAGMQMRYDLEKKDRDITQKSRDIRLLTRQTALQQTALHSQAHARNLSFIAVGLLTLSLGISYNRYRFKQKAHLKLSEAHHILGEQKEEIHTQNEFLRQLVTEREWLLKEVHHRVKNNLQIVISLLNSQLANIKDAAAMDVIRESQHRMRSISLIHQKLYQHDNLTGINAADYIHELARYLRESFDPDGRIRFVIEADPIELDVSQAVPVGLILNEAITNTLKYAFTHQPEKRVSIRLTALEGRCVKLEISDNGTGLPAGFDSSACHSLGMQLMTGLSRQLRGDLRLINQNGLTIVLTWQKAEVLSVADQVQVEPSLTFTAQNTMR